MKKLTRRGFTAAGILAALGAGITALPGCQLIRCNVPETVYGPPSWFEPSNNQEVDVYGPPDVDPSEWDSPEDDEYEVEENEPAALYGPPPEDEYEDYNTDDNMAVGVYGPPEDYQNVEYDATDNVMQTMYGPMEVYDLDDAN